MSGSTNNGLASAKSQSHREMKLVTREQVIDTGLNALQEIGISHICKVCIFHGGSCCSGCRNLSDQVGCQLRNTSCTAWLCGFLKYMLYKTGLLEEWNDFWDQVPGQDYREDFTPEMFFMKKGLDIPDMQELSAALAEDLDLLAQKQGNPDFILSLRDKLDKNIDQFYYYTSEPIHKNIKRNIDRLADPFHRFHQALSSYQPERSKYQASR
ncbi:hypothetical protein [Paenibacillus nasutitermitis]|uniref:DNA mismatch repair protein n=1 Tax=Paenibacillus nasutitermitis TaxID=1652958 RepID=A0A916ZKR5_9BACL|nr:hypothetical protein [Paenibacillus nasutitermitis]GGE01904.1 hypothetical protein GCM10010911_71130 [Paenibacillus nasutitermitis]